MNGKLISDATDLEKSETLVAVADAPFLSNDRARRSAVHGHALARHRRPKNRRGWSNMSTAAAPRTTRKQALADVFWALLEQRRVRA